MSYKTEEVAARECSKCGAEPNRPCIGKRGARRAFHLERIRGVEAVVQKRPRFIVPFAYEPGDSAETLFERGLEAQNRKRRASFTEVLGACESPIEELLIAALCTHLRTHPAIKLMPDVDDRLAQPGDGFVWFVPQADVGPYRADFLIKDCRDARIRRTVVECDGHDYHERTKQQAQRDRSRDRWFTSNGFAVLRFTGSEIYRNPISVADEIAEYLERC